MIILLELLKKNLGKSDYVILIIAVFMFSHLDYENLDTVEIIYVVSFGLWVVLLGVRIFILYKNEGDK